MKDTRAYRSADIGSDHRLLCTVVNLRLSKQTTEKRRCGVMSDTARLRNEEVLRRFNIALQNRSWRTRKQQLKKMKKWNKTFR